MSCEKANSLMTRQNCTKIVQKGERGCAELEAAVSYPRRTLTCAVPMPKMASQTQVFPKLLVMLNGMGWEARCSFGQVTEQNNEKEIGRDARAWVCADGGRGHGKRGQQSDHIEP